jgi:hypothetical protein
MPYRINLIRNTNPKKYQVINTETHEVKAKRTTLTKARAQMRLLEGLEHGTLTPRSNSRKRSVSGVRTYPSLMSTVKR